MTDRIATSAPFVPLRLDGRPLAHKAALVFIGTLFLAASSYIEVPMVPVPVTMQTYAVLIVGALAGWRLGAITVIAWLAEAFVGFPVLSGGAGGAMHFVGPTAGYLFGFPLVAAFAGWLAEQGWTRKIVPAFLGLLLAQAICFVPGALWLATFTGLEKAIALGVTPFIVGAVLKAALAVCTLVVAKRAITKRAA